MGKYLRHQGRFKSDRICAWSWKYGDIPLSGRAWICVGYGRMVWWAYCCIHIVIEKNHFDVLKWLYKNGCCLFGTASHCAGACCTLAAKLGNLGFLKRSRSIHYSLLLDLRDSYSANECDHPR